MYFLALAVDYDETVAVHGIIAETTLEAMRRLKASGRKLILVTGRELPELLAVCPQVAIFDRVVAENGALLYKPSTKEEEPLAPAPPPAFIQRLMEMEISPLSVGRSIVATREPNEAHVLHAIQDFGLEHHIIFNKGAVMVLPPNVNKATGLAAALKVLNISPLNVVAVGDAENDHSFLTHAGCGAAVANAIDSLKAKADVVLKNPNGHGVSELIGRIVEDDLMDVAPSLPRQAVVIGEDVTSGEVVSFTPHHGTTLICGTSGSGKSTVVTALLERMAEQRFRFCAVDPEGDQAVVAKAVVLGDARQAPGADDVLELLGKQAGSAIVNMMAVDAPDRQKFLTRLISQLVDLRAKTGRPHWLVIDEAHLLLPASDKPAVSLPWDNMPATIMVTVKPDEMSPAALSRVETVIAVGPEAGSIIAGFAAAGEHVPAFEPQLPGRAWIWTKRDGQVRSVRIERPKSAQKRHARKYAKGELGEDKSFYFRGPDNALNLRAQNLVIFLQMAAGVDDRTWLFHLKNGDYSRWLRDMIKDPDLAAEVGKVEHASHLGAAETRARVKELIDHHYTGPATTEA